MVTQKLSQKLAHQRAKREGCQGLTQERRRLTQGRRLFHPKTPTPTSTPTRRRSQRNEPPSVKKAHRNAKKRMRKSVQSEASTQTFFE